MSDLKPKILIISSANPFKGPGVLGVDARDAFISQGYECDLLTKYEVPEHPEIISICKNGISFLQRVIRRIEHICFILLTYLTSGILYTRQQKPEFCFFYAKEEIPPVSSRKILRKIQKDYDLVIIYFWQELLTFKTVEAIYDKLHCPIMFKGVDYSQMAGGCHFTGPCIKYMTGCGSCDGLGSTDPNDFTHHNVKYRKRVYDKVKPIVFGNSYMTEFYNRSFLLKDYKRKELGYPIINGDDFYPMNVDALRLKYDISDKVEYVLFFGSQNVNDERKGITYMLESFMYFHDLLSEEERKSVVLLIAGQNIDAIKGRLPFNYIYVGYVPSSQLPELYSVANVFISPSVNDAGPMMVNQSLMCGTPVVGFAMGAMLDAVKDKGTGFCAPLRDSLALADCLLKMYRLVIDQPEEYMKMRETCADFGVRSYTPKYYVEHIMSVYDKYKDGK